MKTSPRLRILKYPWHTGHDYELLKMPHDFFLLTNTYREWNIQQRPLPPNTKTVTSINEGNCDVAILHLDQWSIHECAKQVLFDKIKREFTGPKIIINHGSNFVDGCSSEDMQRLCEGCHVVCNSPTALVKWNLKNSTYIRHGMNCDEWPQTNFGLNNVVMTTAGYQRHPKNRNQDAIDKALGHFPIDWIGRDLKFSTPLEYKTFLANSSIFLNLSHASASPRARTEAMLCGLAIVTTASHGEESYIENGVNGFASNDENKLIEYVSYLLKNPEQTKQIGINGRTFAQNYFSWDQFASSWNDLLSKVTGIH